MANPKNSRIFGQNQTKK
ncbi:hypothetical protein, partial [Kingella kingae]